MSSKVDRGRPSAAHRRALICQATTRVYGEVAIEVFGMTTLKETQSPLRALERQPMAVATGRPATA